MAMGELKRAYQAGVVARQERRSGALGAATGAGGVGSVDKDSPGLAVADETVPSDFLGGEHCGPFNGRGG
jgi:hypothetical protein